MQDNEQVYLVARFGSPAHLQQAVQSLLASNTAHNHIVILDDGSNLAQSLGVGTDLNADVGLDDATKERLEWHREQGNGPFLAVQVLAVNGRDLRHQLNSLGADMLDAPNLNTQVMDLDVDPGMPTDEPELPNQGRLSDNLSPVGAPENE